MLCNEGNSPAIVEINALVPANMIVIAKPEMSMSLPFNPIE
jgi:hypothetical protein